MPNGKSEQHFDKVEAEASTFVNKVVEAFLAVSVDCDGGLGGTVEHRPGRGGDGGCLKYDPPWDEVEDGGIQDHFLLVFGEIFEE